MDFPRPDLDFFRVNYDATNWGLLKQYLVEFHTLMEPVGRAMLVDDALVLARSGRLDYGVALDFVDYLRVEGQLAPWEAARRGFDHLDAQFYESEYESQYKVGWGRGEKSCVVAFRNGKKDEILEGLENVILTLHRPQTWVLQLVDRVFMEAGFLPGPRDQHSDRLTRETSASWACDLGHKHCTQYGRTDFPLWLADPNRWRVNMAPESRQQTVLLHT